MNALHWLDYTVLAIYLIVLVAVCVRVARRSPTAEDLFLAGRSLGVGVVGLSLFASNISSTTLIGLPGAAWQHGIAVANYEWMAALVLIFSAMFIIPRLLRERVTTIPQWLENRFDARLRKYLSAVTVFLSIMLDTAGSLYAGALVLLLFFPSLSLAPTIAVIAVLAGIYTAAGGLRAVAYTDVLQTVVLLAGSLLLTVMVFGEFDYSWAAVKAQLPPDQLSLIRPMDDPQLPWLGTVIGLPVLGFYYWTMNQYVSQRLLGSRNEATAGRGAIVAATLKMLPLFIMVLPGAMAAALFTDLERSDMVFPTLIAEYAPVGVAGLILAGLLAAIMSSVDSALNSSSTLISVDFLQPRRPHWDPQAMARTGRIITLVLMLIAATWAPMIDHFPGLFAYLQQGFAYVTPPLVAVFLLGSFSHWLGARAALRTVITGHVVSVVWFIATEIGWIGLHFTIVAGILLAISVVAAVFWQSLESAAAERPSQSVSEGIRAGLRGLPADVFVAAAGLVAITAVTVWCFR